MPVYTTDRFSYNVLGVVLNQGTNVTTNIQLPKNNTAIVRVSEDPRWTPVLFSDFVTLAENATRAIETPGDVNGYTITIKVNSGQFEVTFNGLTDNILKLKKDMVWNYTFTKPLIGTINFKGAMTGSDSEAFILVEPIVQPTE